MLVEIENIFILFKKTKKLYGLFWNKLYIKKEMNYFFILIIPSLI